MSFEEFDLPQSYNVSATVPNEAVLHGQLSDGIRRAGLGVVPRCDAAGEG